MKSGETNEPALSAVAVSVTRAYFLAAGSDAAFRAGRALTAAAHPSVQAVANAALAGAPAAALDPVGLPKVDNGSFGHYIDRLHFDHVLDNSSSFRMSAFHCRMHAMTLSSFRLFLSYLVARRALAEPAVVALVAVANAANTLASVRADLRLSAVGGDALQPVLYRGTFVAVAGLTCTGILEFRN